MFVASNSPRSTLRESLEHLQGGPVALFCVYTR